MALSRVGVFIVGAKRTPFGTFGGSLKDVDSIELAAIASRAALTAANVNAEQVDTVICGNVGQSSSKNGPYLARHAGLKAGIKVQTPCLTINRLCGSGFQSVINGSQEIALGDAQIALCASSESMSQAPFVMRGARWGVKFTKTPELECSLWSTLTDWHINTPMGITAENLSKKYAISREDCDKFALLSQTRWNEANQKGRFKNEMAPITIKTRKGEILFEVDEHPQPNTTLESLAKLRPSFDKNGVCTAGNSSGIGDGAGAIVLASESAVSDHKLKPLARVVDYAIVGCDPSIMGIGPVEAVRKLCKNNGLNLHTDIDLVDINEAFASQFLSVAKELELDMNKTNVNGGAIALAHPVGASGGRITANIVHELIERKARRAIVGACIGGGQGVCLLIEKV